MIKRSKKILVIGKAAKWLHDDLAAVPTALFLMRQSGWNLLELLIFSYSFLPELELCRGEALTSHHIETERSDFRSCCLSLKVFSFTFSVSSQSSNAQLLGVKR